LAEGQDVLCVDNYFTGRCENIQRFLNRPRFEPLRHDICVPLNVETDRIFNRAYPASPVHCPFDPVQTTLSEA